MDKLPLSPIEQNGDQLPTILFRLEDTQKIFEAINHSKSLQLGQSLFTKPLQSIDLAASKDSQSTFDLTATIRLSAEDIDELTELIAQTVWGGEKGEEKGGMYTLIGENGTKFLMGSQYDVLWLTTGKALDPYGEDTARSNRRLFEPLALIEENVTTSLVDYSMLLEEITTTAYLAQGEIPPDEEVLIKAPEKSLSSRLGQAAIRGIEDITDTLEVNVTDITFESIGGQQKAKTELEKLVFAVANPELYESWGTTPPKGILVHGPSGTGKTLLAKALAAKAGARFLYIKPSDIGSMWYGESERIVQGIFAYADRDERKAIIYFDEIDTIVPPRDGSHEATQKVIGTILQNIDGMDSSDNITVMASTNRIDSVDSAMLRPGRLDRHIEVALPTEVERHEIFGVHIAKAEAKAKRTLFEAIDIATLSTRTDKYSGADIAEVIRRTLEEKVFEEGKQLSPTLVRTDDIYAAIADYEHVKKEKKRMGF